MTQWLSKLGGKRPIVGWLNKLLDCCKASEIRQVIGGRLIEDSSGKTLVIDVPTRTGGGLSLMLVKAKVGDVLICHTWDGTNEGAVNIPVAVNQESRQKDLETINSITYTYDPYSPLDSFNDQRTSTSDADDSEETQIVTPLWFEDCLIQVATTTASLVEFSDDIDISYEGEPYDIKLIEVSSRCWAKVIEE